MKAPSIPDAVYRLQFNRDFTFSQAAELLPYLASLEFRIATLHPTCGQGPEVRTATTSSIIII